MTGNISKISYFAGLDIDKKYRTVYSGSLAAYKAFLVPYLLPGGVDVPHGEQSDTWRESQTELFTENPAAASAEYVSVELTNGENMFYFVDSVETLDDDLTHLSIILDEWATYTRTQRVKLKNAVLLEGHGGALHEFTDEGDHAKTIKFETTDAAHVFPTNYHGAGEIVPASDAPFAYRPIIVAELKEKIVGIFTTNKIEPIVFTNANATPLRFDAARQFCAAWGNIQECYFYFGGSTKKADFAIKAAYIVPEYFIDFATGQRVISPEESTVTNYDGVIVKAGIKSKEKYYTAAADTSKKAFGTITTRAQATGQYQNISTRLKVDAVTTYYGFFLYMEAFGQRVEVTQDFAASLFTSEANARTAAQKTSEALQTVGQMSSAIAAIATGAATAQPTAILGGAVALGGAAVNVARNQKSAPVIRNQGSAEQTFATYDGEPANVYKSGFAIWNTPAENADYIDAMTEEYGFAYPGGVYFPEITSIFRGQTTQNKTFVKFGGDCYVVGIPTGDAEAIENALKNGVIIKKL